MIETNRLFMEREKINQDSQSSTTKEKAYAEEKANVALWEMGCLHFGNGLLPEKWLDIWLINYRTALQNIIDTRT